MAYSELIKNFDKIRSYMKDFYIYGFKSREDFSGKSARSYDNEKRRIESYLGDYVSFSQDKSGKRVFISIDGRNVTHNPLYKAFKAKSFTNKDITLHFIVMDILESGKSYTLKELIEIIDKSYLLDFEEPLFFDESTLRKKMKEYVQLGIVIAEKDGRIVTYKKNQSQINLEEYRVAISFFSEESPLGVVGSFLEDKIDDAEEFITFKNHYMMNAYDTEILYKILQGIHEQREIEIGNLGRRKDSVRYWRVIPLKLFISTQGGRNYLLCQSEHGNIISFRIDYIQSVEVGDVVSEYEEALSKLEATMRHMWGVTSHDGDNLEHIDLDIYVGENESFIVDRLEREKRCGSVTRMSEHVYRFSADVYDTYEMVPWIRSFMGRIENINCTNESVKEQIMLDVEKMSKIYRG